MPPARSSVAVRREWGARIAAEYTSAAVTQHFVLWLMQAGAPPDLIDDGLVVVRDELAHSRLSHEVFVAAGGDGVPALQQTNLGLSRQSEDLTSDLTTAVLRVYCLGETIAVPLFRHLRARCTEPVARRALDRILRDEVRHRDFGWDVLDWLMQTSGDRVKAEVEAALPAMLTMLESQYGVRNRVVASDDGAIDDDDRAWGLAAPREYAEILEKAIAKEYVGRFAARGIDWHASTKRA
jgi:hypothetical protein